MTTTFHVYDTTMRDGAQQEGINLSVADKLTIARHLDDLGVTRLRAGGRGRLIIHADVRTPTRLDGEQEDLLRRLAEVRDETEPSGQLADVDSGFMGRLRHAFKGR